LNTLNVVKIGDSEEAYGLGSEWLHMSFMFLKMPTCEGFLPPGQCAAMKDYPGFATMDNGDVMGGPLFNTTLFCKFCPGNSRV